MKGKQPGEGPDLPTDAENRTQSAVDGADAASETSGQTAGVDEAQKPRGSSRRTDKRRLQKEREALEDRLVRLQADFENFRRRTVREKNEVYRMANEDVMLDMLPVLDHLELAMKASEAHEAHDATVEGFRLVGEQLLSVLRKFGLVPVDARGQVFDPVEQEAISHLPFPDVPANHVAEQVRRGYRLGEKLLRPCQVVVSSGPPAADADGQDNAT